ncbi:MAG: HAD hydrolase family protein [Clostridiales bacterium]
MLKDIKAVAFDLDGTIYYGSKIIDGANEAISHAKSKGIKVFFLTNNSTKTRMQIYEKLIGMGILCDYEEVFTSGYIATLYAKKEKLNNIYIFGSKNLISEFHDIGIDVVDESQAENLLIGYDPAFTYESLTKALHVALKAKKSLPAIKKNIFPGKMLCVYPVAGLWWHLLNFVQTEKAM